MIYMCDCTYAVYRYTYVYIYIYTLYRYTYIYVYVYVYVYMYICMHMYICTCTCIDIQTHRHVHFGGKQQHEFDWRGQEEALRRPRFDRQKGGPLAEIQGMSYLGCLLAVFWDIDFLGCYSLIRFLMFNVYLLGGVQKSAKV